MHVDALHRPKYAWICGKNVPLFFFLNHRYRESHQHITRFFSGKKCRRNAARQKLVLCFVRSSKGKNARACFREQKMWKFTGKMIRPRGHAYVLSCFVKAIALENHINNIPINIPKPFFTKNCTKNQKATKVSFTFSATLRNRRLQEHPTSRTITREFSAKIPQNKT